MFINWFASPTIGEIHTYFSPLLLVVSLLILIYTVKPILRGHFFILIDLIDLTWFIVFNATFSNISAISWQPVLVERTTDHGQATVKLYHLRLWVERTFFCFFLSVWTWLRFHLYQIILITVWLFWTKVQNLFLLLSRDIKVIRTKASRPSIFHWNN
jgi:hypothetical protein